MQNNAEILPIQNQEILDSIQGIFGSTPLKKPSSYVSNFNYDYWLDEPFDKMFEIAKENQRIPLTIKQIRAKGLRNLEELKIIELLDTLVKGGEIEYHKEKNNIGEEVYFLEPLDNQLIKRKDWHSHNYKIGENVLFDLVEKVKNEFWDKYCQDANEEIEKDFVEQGIDAVNDLENWLEFLKMVYNSEKMTPYKVDDINTFVKIINKKGSIPKHYSNEETDFLKAIEWELKRMFRVKALIECVIKRARELKFNPNSYKKPVNTNSYEDANTRIKNSYPYFINDVDFEDFKDMTPFEIWFIFKFDYFIENVESVNQVERSKDFKYSEQQTKYLPSETSGKYAYYERMPFDILNNKIDNNEYYFKDFSIVDFRSNTNYIKLFDSYRRGFKNGYDSFKDGNSNIRTVFAYLKKQSYKYPEVQKDRPLNKDKWVEILTEEDFETWGRRAGERYMVWYHILQDATVYSTLFLADESMIKMYQNGLSVLSGIPQMSTIVERLKALLNKIEPSTDHEEDKGKKGKEPFKRSIALYYYFLIATGIEKKFEDREKLIGEVIKDICSEWNMNDSQFRNDYNSMTAPSQRKIKDRYKERNYREAIQLLNENPIINKKAIELAEREFAEIFPLS